MLELHPSRLAASPLAPQDEVLAGFDWVHAMTDGMKDQYDFSKAERGRFYRKDAVLVAPVHLDPEVLTFLTA
jgi:hypothetical protein